MNQEINWENNDYENEELWKVLKKEDENRKKELDPTVLLSVWINEAGEIEEYNLIEQFTGGEYGEELKSNSDDYCDYMLENAGIYDICTQKDTLYHIYCNIEYYQCGGEYNEWDINFTILNAIPVVSNYLAFYESENNSQEQKRLSRNDSNFMEINTDKYDSFYPTLTYNDFENFIKIVAEKDIKLAHRLCIKDNSWYSKPSIDKEVLGELFNEKISQIEMKRMEFKSYITKYKNKDIEFWFSKNGYKVKSKKREYYDETVDITFQQINEIEDDILLNYDCEYILEMLYFAPKLMDILVEKED